MQILAQKSCIPKRLEGNRNRDRILILVIDILVIDALINERSFILRIRIAQCVQGHTAGETHHALQYISRFDQCHILLEKNDCVVHRVKLQRVSLIEFAQDQGGVLNNNPAAIGVIDKLHMVSSFNLSF